MKNWGLSVAGAALAGAVALGAVPAIADGLHGRERYREPQYDSLATWAGFYLGGYAGFAHAWADVSINDYPVVSMSETDVVLGGIFGYNIQHGSSVYGVEAAVGVVGGDGNFELRGRYGLASDNWLYFGTAGVSFGGASSYSAYGVHAEVDDTAFVLGGGAETKIGRNMNLGIEGLFYFYGDNTVDYGPVHADASGDAFVVRGRLTWQLNGLR